MVKVLASKHQEALYPGSNIKGSSLAWGIGDKAIFTAPSSGKQYNVVIDSDLMEHEDAPGNGLIYEVTFKDGSGRHAVLADALTP